MKLRASVTIFISEEILNSIEKYRELLRLSRSGFIIECIKASLNKMEGSKHPETPPKQETNHEPSYKKQTFELDDFTANIDSFVEMPKQSNAAIIKEEEREKGEKRLKAYFPEIDLNKEEEKQIKKDEQNPNCVRRTKTTNEMLGDGTLKLGAKEGDDHLTSKDIWKYEPIIL